MAARPTHDEDDFPPPRPFGEPCRPLAPAPSDDEDHGAGGPPAPAPAGAQPVSRS